MTLKIPEEIEFDDIVKDEWLFQKCYCELDNIVVINRGTGYYFCDDKTVSAGKNKRPLSVKERFTIELLRNNKCH